LEPICVVTVEHYDGLVQRYREGAAAVGAGDMNPMSAEAKRPMLGATDGSSSPVNNAESVGDAWILADSK
jgi:hypothetical protein